LSLPLHGFQVSGLMLADYDNDGWLDLFAYGSDGVRVWRNAGHAGFADVTAELGLDHAGPVTGWSPPISAATGHRPRDELGRRAALLAERSAATGTCC
jgi:hypothetical protein